MTRYQVDSEAVSTAVAHAKGSIGRIQAEVSGLHGQLTSLQGSWTGGASTAFQAVVTDWKALEHRVDEVLTSLNSALSIAGQQYADIEETNARMFAR
jgi:WXG100 family type VII secretion target